ncbi:MAG TPA: hypothetical protein PKD54_10130 [Pirellulaceae bacterium]|nr:hypothetical protein [Pirellulaceae bacterium]
MMGLNHLRAMIYCGETLLEVKSMLNHGQFKAWVEQNFQPEIGLGLRTCQRYMNKARQYRKVLENQGQVFDPNASILSFLENDNLFNAFQLFCNISGNVSHDDEHWGTPDSILIAVRKVLGSIDTDPCASQYFNTADPEGVSFDAQSDGLANQYDWRGNVYIAPGVRGDICRWLETANGMIKCGSIQAAVVLFPAVFTASIVKQLSGCPLCILSDPLIAKSMASGELATVKLTQPMAVALFANEPDIQRFFSAFRGLGAVYAPYGHPFEETSGIITAEVTSSKPARIQKHESNQTEQGTN